MLAALAVGCADQSRTAGPSADDPLIAKLISLGFRRDMIEDRGDNFLVEGDMVMYKRDIAELVDGERGLRPDFQWRTTNVVSQPQVQNIGVSLSGLASVPAYQTAARQAIAEWNRVNCSNLRFFEGSPVLITFRTISDASRPGTAAEAPGPSSAGLPGSFVQVNLRYTGPISDAIRKYVMVHEMGHTIGFRHTNWQGKETAAQFGGAIQISGTPATDANSVMNTGIRSWTEFSYYDRIATRNLYPNFNPAICVSANLSGPTQIGPYYTCTWTANPTGGTPPYRYAWNGGAFGTGSIYRTSASGQSGFIIGVAVLDAVGRRAEHSIGVNVYQYAPPC
jgi:hypothetical protein